MPYEKKRLRWFPWDVDAAQDLAVQDLLQERGPAGFGIMVQVFSDLHAWANEGEGHPSSSGMISRVSHALYCDPSEVSDVCEFMAAHGLLDAELWSEGKAANDHASADILRFRAKSEAGKAGAAAKWGK